MHRRRIEPLWTNSNAIQQHSEKPKPSVQYVRDRLGQLKYVVTIDLSGFVPSDIHVRLQREVVIIEAEHQRHVKGGVLDTHELKYNFSLPASVTLSTVRHAIDANSIFRLEGSVKEAIRPNFASQPNRQQSLNFARKPPNGANNAAFVNRQQGGRILHELSPTPNRDKRVSFMDADIRRDTNKNYQKKTMLQTPLPPMPLVSRLDNVDSVRSVVLQGDTPRQRAGLRPQASEKVFNLRVAVGAHFRAEDVSVSHSSGIVAINARRIINGLTYTHYSEHTIPGGASIDRLSSHVEDGNVIVHASFVRK